MSQIINAATTAINEQRRKEAEQKATRIILSIVGLNAAIEARNKSLGELQDKLQKLANDRYNAVQIVGELPEGEASKVVLDTISKLNHNEKDRVAQECALLDQQIRDGQACRDNQIKERDELRKALAQIKVDNIVATDLGV